MPSSSVYIGSLSLSNKKLAVRQNNHPRRVFVAKQVYKNGNMVERDSAGERRRSFAGALRPSRGFKKLK